MRPYIMIIALMTTLGCGSIKPPQLAGPVNVNGKVVTSAGKPVGGVAVNLQPLEEGYEKKVDVNSDGTFTVETHAGKYAYYFTPKSGANKVPPQVANFVEANLGRTVKVSSGEELLIHLP